MRAYVGLQPPKHVRESISQHLARLSSEPNAAWVGPDHFHVTLRFLGDVRAHEKDFEDFKAACAMTPARTVTFDGNLQELGGNALVVPVSGADDLGYLARQTVDKAADVIEPDRFFGHMTVSLPSSAAELAWAAEMVGSEVGGEWFADDVCLFISEVTDGAKRYRVIERFPLALPALAGER